MTLVIFENFEIPVVLLGQFQNFQNCARATYPKSPSHFVITSTNFVPFSISDLHLHVDLKLRR